MAKTTKAGRVMVPVSGQDEAISFCTTMLGALAVQVVTCACRHHTPARPRAVAGLPSLATATGATGTTIRR